MDRWQLSVVRINNNNNAKAVKLYCPPSVDLSKLWDSSTRTQYSHALQQVSTVRCHRIVTSPIGVVNVLLGR